MILFEKMKEEECKLGTEIKWARCREPVKSTLYKSIQGKEKGSTDPIRSPAEMKYCYYSGGSPLNTLIFDDSSEHSGSRTGRSAAWGLGNRQLLNAKSIRESEVMLNICGKWRGGGCFRAQANSGEAQCGKRIDR